MRPFALLVMVIPLAGGLFAEHRGFGPTYGSRSGFGNVVFPGTGHAPSSGGPSFVSVPFSGFHQPVSPVVYVPYAYPYPVLAPYPQQQAPNVIVVYAQQPQPQVIINHNYAPETARPEIREYPEASTRQGIRTYEAPTRASSENDSGPDYYLIAFKDHSIYSAMAYWVEGESLHYVTSQGVHNQASLDLVDRDFTEKLNKDRNVQVRLANPR